MQLNGRVLILVEDGTFVFDHRVRREASTLIDRGATVTVICPRYPGESRFEIVDGVRVYRYPKPNLGSGLMGHAGEYIASLFFGFVLSLWVLVRRGVDVAQFCNPPDFLFPIAWMLRLFGRKIVFDHHDLCPELYLSRFSGTREGFAVRFLLLCERLTLRSAHHVISTNESYRRIAMKRAGLPGDRVTVVRNGPSLTRFDPDSVVPLEREPGTYRVGYVGNMNPQDGVHYLLDAARVLKDRGRDDIHFYCVGGGDSLDFLRKRTRELDLESRVTFTGRISDEAMVSTLGSCDLGVQPDPKNPLNDVSTMNKVMEFMALGLPVVAFDLIETRVSCGDAALYARPNSVDDLASLIEKICDDSVLRAKLATCGRERVVQKLAWTHSEDALCAVYGRLLSPVPSSRVDDGGAVVNG